MYEPYLFDKNTPVRLFESFAGVGMTRLAFKRIGAKVVSVGISEIDKHAIASYQAVHGDCVNYGDIRFITSLPACDIFTYSFPCTDLSKSGKQKGLHGGTRSGLVYDVLRLLKETAEYIPHRYEKSGGKIHSLGESTDYYHPVNHEKLPKVLIMENVEDLNQKKFIRDFNEIKLELEFLGYTNYVQVMNAKNYGVAQNRSRVFMVSILGDFYYKFPQPFTLTKRLKDYLEDEVDEKFYLTNKQLNQISNWKSFQNPLNNVLKDESVSPTITTRVAETDAGGISASMIVYDEHKISNHIIVDLKSSDKFRRKPNVVLAPAILTDSRLSVIEPSIHIPEATKKGYAEAFDGDGVYLNRPHQKRGVVQNGMIQTIKTNSNDIGVVVSSKIKLCSDLVETGLLIDGKIINHSYSNVKKIPNGRLSLNDYIENRDGIMPTLHTRSDTFGYNDNLRIRKLTPRECGRLMDIDDCDIDNILLTVSNAQAYKIFGNGIVVGVFAELLSTLFH